MRRQPPVAVRSLARHFAGLVHFALRGGGAHGPCAPGGLDRLLEEGRLEVETISGTLVGALNAAVLADGTVLAIQDVRSWHLADLAGCPLQVRYRGQSGHDAEGG